MTKFPLFLILWPVCRELRTKFFLCVTVDSIKKLHFLTLSLLLSYFNFLAFAFLVLSALGFPLPRSFIIEHLQIFVL